MSVRQEKIRKQKGTVNIWTRKTKRKNRRIRIRIGMLKEETEEKEG
jgi:hypothetical protein